MEYYFNYLLSNTTYKKLINGSTDIKENNICDDVSPCNRNDLFITGRISISKPRQFSKSKKINT